MLGGDLLVLSSATATVRCVPATACSASRTVAGWPCRRAGPRSSRRLSSLTRAGSDSASRSSGLPDDQPLEGEQLVLELVGLARLLGARHDRDDAEVLEGVAEVAGGRPAATRGRGHQVEPTPGRACSPKMPRTSSALASAGTDTSVATRRRPGSRRRTSATPNRSSPIRSTRPRRPRPPRPRASVSACERVGRRRPRISAPRSRRRPSAAVSRSARKRSTTRLWRASSSSDSPTMRPASDGGQRADLGTERGDRLLALGLDLGVRVLDDARRLGLRLLAHLGDDRRTLLTRVLADARRLVPGVAELLLELGQLGVGLGLLGLGRLAARPRWRSSGRRTSSRSWGRPTS